MYKAYKKGRKKRRDASDDEAETSPQTRAGQTRDGGVGADGIGRRGNVGKRHEEDGEEIRSSRDPRDHVEDG